MKCNRKDGVTFQLNGQSSIYKQTMNYKSRQVQLIKVTLISYVRKFVQFAPPQKNVSGRPFAQYSCFDTCLLNLETSHAYPHRNQTMELSPLQTCASDTSLLLDTFMCILKIVKTIKSTPSVYSFYSYKGVPKCNSRIFLFSKRLTPAPKIIHH